MSQLTPYLTFNGNCREALEFYHNCLGGELRLDAVKDGPAAAQMPADKQDAIMHGSLTTGNMVIMASDRMRTEEAQIGDNVSLCINGASAEELKTFFEKLSAGGKVGQPLQEAFFGTYGDLVDKFDVNWMFQAEPKKE